MTVKGTPGASLLRAASRELAFGLRGTSREVAGWRALAGEIPDRGLRQDALAALTRKRGNIHGAALFWTLPDRRSPALLRSLVAWDVLADYLDCASERGAGRGLANGRRLHLALVEALQPRAPISEHYAHHLSGADGGYARALIAACRSGCEQLPSHAELAGPMVRAARLTEVLAINHEPDPAAREAALREWADRQMPDAEQPFFERTAGASAWLTVFAMLALAARPAHRDGEVEQTYNAYLRSISPVGAMLDSYGDIAEDTAAEHHSYISHYPSMAAAVERVSELIARARTQAAALPDGGRHRLILACMLAFYLSKDTVWSAQLRGGTRRLLAAGGPSAQGLLPVLRAWRVAYGQRGT